MTDELNIDERFRDRAKDWESQPAESTWARLSSRLEEHESGSFQRRRLIFRASTAAGVAALLAISLYMFNTSFKAGGSYAGKTEIEFPEPTGANRGTTLGETTHVDSRLMPASAETSDPDGRGSTNGIVKDINISKSDAGAEEGRPSRPVETTGNQALASKEGPSSDRDLSIQSTATSVFEGNTTDAGTGLPSPATSEPSGAGEGYKMEFMDEYTIQDQRSAAEDATAKETSGRSIQKQQISAGQSQSPGNSGMDTRDASQESYTNYLSTGGYEEGFTRTTMRVFVPTEKKSVCRFAAFEVVDDMLYIDPCRNDRSNIQMAESLPLNSSPVLANLLQYDREALRLLEKKSGEGPCLPSATSVIIVFRTGTGLSWNEETIRIPAQEFCIPEEAQELVRGLKELRDKYSK